MSVKDTFGQRHGRILDFSGERIASARYQSPGHTPDQSWSLKINSVAIWRLQPRSERRPPTHPSDVRIKGVSLGGGGGVLSGNWTGFKTFFCSGRFWNKPEKQCGMLRTRESHGCCEGRFTPFFITFLRGRQFTFRWWIKAEVCLKRRNLPKHCK